MKLLVFSIRDEKGTVFANPFYMAHKGQAIRAFADLVADKTSVVSKHPEDYQLYFLGEFDDDSGLFSCSVPEFLQHGSDFKS